MARYGSSRDELAFNEPAREPDRLVNITTTMKKYIDQKSDIVSHPAFESGILKLQNSKEDNLSATEKAALKSILKPEVPVVRDSVIIDGKLKFIKFTEFIINI